MPDKIPRPDLLDDLKRVAGELGRAPTSGQYAERGEYGSSTVARRFGGWDSALEAAGLDPDETWYEIHGKADVTREELIAELHAAYEVLGKPPTSREMRKHGDYSDRVYERVFGSWNGALKAAKLPINTPNRECALIRKDEFVAEVKRVADKVGKHPSSIDFKKHGRIGYDVFRRWWDEWGEMLADLDLIESYP